MNYKIVIIDEAKIDFRESLLWYKNVDPKLAERFHLSFRRLLMGFPNEIVARSMNRSDILTSITLLVSGTLEIEYLAP